MKKLIPAAFVPTAAVFLNMGLLVEPASAQIFFSSGSPYTQDFDALGSVSNAWTDNSTLPGWYASKTLGGTTVAGYRADTGAANTGALYSYGAAGVNSITDRALGSMASGTPGNFAYGVRFKNDTTMTIANIAISCTGEQWRNGGNASMTTQNLAFSYFISNEPITSSDASGANAWVAFSPLSFNSPTVGATAGALDGNDPANRQVFPATVLTNVVVFLGQEIFFRWLDINDAGNDHALAIDDLTISFPENNPPAIIADGQPQSRAVVVGSSTTFAVTSIGTLPMEYQWQKDGTPVEGVFGSSLVLTNLQLTDAGSYSVRITNKWGSVTSQFAVLQVLPFGAPSIQINDRLAVGTMSAVGCAQLTIFGGFTNGLIFYTLDGRTPNTSSPFYTGPVALTDSAIVRAMSLSADFTQTAFAPPTTVQIIPVFNLQISVVGGGTIRVGPTNGPYASNTVVVLTASAEAGWALDHWTGDLTGSQNPASLTMEGPRSVQAVFVQTAYPLTAGTPGGGTVSVNEQVIPPSTFFPVGSVVTVTAVASNGWSFLGWRGDVSGTTNPLSLTMNQTNTVQGIFGTVVGTNTAGGGGIVLSRPNPISYGTDVTASPVPDAGNYFVTWSGAASGTNAPTTITVTSANPTVSALFSTLPGGKYSLAVVVMGNGSVAVNPQQNYYSPGDSVTLSASTTNAGSRFYGWTRDASGTNNAILVVVSTNITVQANFGASPTVNISPQSLIVLAGSNAVINANAAGLPPLSYQWQNSQGAIAGATNASYTIFRAHATNSGNYSVIVSNSFGSVTSDVATVTVVFPPSIMQGPQSWTVAAGTVLNLNVSASGTAPLSYQWVKSLEIIPGATNAIFTLNPAQTNNADSYFVVVSNLYGSVTSVVATVTVYVPVSITTQPASRIVPAWSTVSLSVVAGGYPAPAYQWAFNGTNLPGATASTLTITNVLLPAMGDYAVLVGNGYSSQLSTPATLMMSPSIISPFGGATTIWGKSAVLSVGAIGSGQLSYQWYMNGITVDGATNATLNFTSIQFTNGGLYSVVVYGPFGVTTNVAAQVVVNPAGVSLGFCPALTIDGVAGYSYIIQSSTNLRDTNAWVTLTNLTLTQSVELWVDTNVDASSPAASKYFYRVLPGQ